MPNKVEVKSPKCYKHTIMTLFDNIFLQKLYSILRDHKRQMYQEPSNFYEYITVKKLGALPKQFSKKYDLKYRKIPKVDFDVLSLVPSNWTMRIKKKGPFTVEGLTF
jgi:hypothetical protein